MSPDTQTAYSALTNFNNSAPSAQTIQQQAADKYNVGGLTTRLSGLQTGVNNLQTSLNQVDPSVTGRLEGNFGTTAQRSALISKEQAPIAQNLGTENTLLSQGQTDLNNANTQANGYSTAVLNDQAKSYQQLLDSYNAANARDQFAATQKFEQAKLDEQAREANMRTSAGSSGGYDIGSILGALGGGGTAPAGPAAKVPIPVQRAGGGFNFTDMNGNAISAAQYAKATGQDFRSVLNAMASKGDQGAKAALGFVGNDFGYDPSKIGGNSALYNALVSGTGRQYITPTKPTAGYNPAGVMSRITGGLPGGRR